MASAFTIPTLRQLTGIPPCKLHLAFFEGPFLQPALGAGEMIRANSHCQCNLQKQRVRIERSLTIPRVFLGAYNETREAEV